MQGLVDAENIKDVKTKVEKVLKKEKKPIEKKLGKVKKEKILQENIIKAK